MTYQLFSAYALAMNILDRFRRATAPENIQHPEPVETHMQTLTALVTEIVERSRKLSKCPDHVEPAEAYEAKMEHGALPPDDDRIASEQEVTMRHGDMLMHARATSIHDGAEISFSTSFTSQIPIPGKSWKAHYAGLRVQTENLDTPDHSVRENNTWSVPNDSVRSQALNAHYEYQRQLMNEVQSSLIEIRNDLDKRLNVAREAARPVLQARDEQRRLQQEQHDLAVREARAEIDTLLR